MSILMGPVLSFRGCEDGNWNLSAIVVFDQNPEKILMGRKKISPDILWETEGGTVHRFKFSTKMKDIESKIDYKIGDLSYEVTIPSTSQAPTMAYASCNGFSSLKLMKGVKDKNAIWKVMARRHGLNDVVHEQGMPETEPATPYHLLLQGGDQVYADAMWEIVPSMHEWNEKDWHSGNAAPLTSKMQKALDKFFFELYVSRWSQPDVARILARVPSIAMWDDHDLIDGWGSYPPERQNCAVFGGIWTAASKAFAVFQQHLMEGERRPESRREQAAGSENVINQLISSAIVHPGPGAVVLFALQHLFDSEEEIDRGLFGRMMTFPNSKSKFLGGRNYLSIEPDAINRLWCNWFVEGQDYPFTKVIHPLRQAAGEAPDSSNS